MTKIIYHCRCGENHEIDPNKPVWKSFFEVTKGTSEYSEVNINGRKWRIPKMYIAIHGLKGKEISELGFQEL